MLTRVLFALVLLLGTAVAASAEETKVVALGIADHEVTQAELEEGVALPAPRFNTPAVAYVLVAGVKTGDTVEIAFNLDDQPLHRNTADLAEDKASLLLQAGKRGVPAGGWPEGSYSAKVEVVRDGKPILTQTSTPMVFE